MKVKLTFAYTAIMTPPRCRKPREVTQEGCIAVTFREVTGEEAPVAISSAKTTLRWYKNKLYHQLTGWTRTGVSVSTTAKDFVEDYTDHVKREHTYSSLPSARRAIMAKVRSVLLIDGWAWVASMEPYYEVTTFGLGHNHGGTALMVGHGFARDSFKLNQLEAAIAQATKVATERGDTNDLPITPHEVFTVHIPEAIKSKRGK